MGDKLGKGGFGSVYKATRRRDGLEVAVKCTVKSPKMKEMTVPGYDKPLPTEIALTIMANNGPYVPEIIQLLDWEDNDAHYIIIMERPIPCMDLLHFLRHKDGPLDEKTGRHIMRQAIHAVSVCFDRGVFHRDIKLENLLVNPDTLEVKLIDFGCGAIVKKSGYKVFCGKCYELCCHKNHTLKILFKHINHWMISFFSRNKNIFPSGVRIAWQVPCTASDCLVSRDRPVRIDVWGFTHCLRPLLDQGLSLV
nr:serine/threonine-protein kinase pim-2 [Danio rerio]|eukprot:XP_021330921.1 serine/threonine-protein kinase pim-2 [Danio rerio]